MKRAANSFVPERQRFTLMSIRSGTVTGPKKVLIRLLGLSALLVLALAPLTTSADRVSIQILDPERFDPDSPPGEGTIVDESNFDADGPVAPLSFDDDIFNSPASMLDCCAGALAGSGRVVAEVDRSTSTVRAGAALSLNEVVSLDDPERRRTGKYLAEARAQFDQDYYVSSDNPSATTEILVTGIISGSMRHTKNLNDFSILDAFVTAELSNGGFPVVANVTCVVNAGYYGPPTADCNQSSPAPDVFIDQDASDPFLFHVSGTISGTVQAPVNQVSRFGAGLFVSVHPSTESQSSSDFSDSLVLTLTSLDPDTTVTPVPEPARALQIVAALVTLAVVGSARRAGRRI
jgi:hypothetical protein